jgi:3-hydroxyacyl-CoA dehydrogenase/enoyl-CoA hydratase/3-hydroxybutyryl-CoA epimerase
MHYFSPVHKMPLLEVIVTPKTAPWVTATCVDLGKKQGKTVIVVRDGAGFYTSRILAPYMNEAAHLVAEGVAVERIDEALVQWGFPVGPITLLDEVGIDVGEKVGHIMQDAFGARMQAPPGMDRLVADQRFGRKNKRGFYLYSEGGKKKKGEGKKRVDESVYRVLGVSPTNEMPLERIAERCALQMVNEAALCLGEGILRSARDGDIGAVFGLGFPPFRGGPFRYVEVVGASEIVRRLEALRALHGQRFTPAPLLAEMAGAGAARPSRNRHAPER